MFALDVATSSAPAPSTSSDAQILARRRAFSSPRHKSSFPSLTRRRSVRSMKNLLPLTLPASNCYCNYTLPDRSYQPFYLRGEMAAAATAAAATAAAAAAVEEADAAAEDCNLPELLAHDLQFSNLVFAAKNLTAGAPSRDLASEGEGGGSEWPTQTTATSDLCNSSSSHPVVRFQSNQALVGQEVRLKGATEGVGAGGKKQYEDSDSESSSTTGRSLSELEPASIRQHSVVTAATTMTCGRLSAASHKRNTSLGHDTNASWIDLEPDAAESAVQEDEDQAQDEEDQEEEEEEEGSKATEDVQPRVLPRTRRSSNPGGYRMPSPTRASSAAAADRRLSSPFETLPRPPHRTWSLQAYPQTVMLPEMARRSLNYAELVVPQRRSSLRNQLSSYPYPEPPPSDRFSHTPEPQGNPTPALELTAEPEKVVDIDDEPSEPELDLGDEIEPWFRYDDEQGNAEFEGKRQSKMKHMSTLGISSPMDDVQVWLEGSSDPPVTTSEDLSRRIPLPPEVVETLRVSITCFPETMLLCSSLSIETIRSYAKKMKHPANEPAGRLLTPPPSPKRWKWASVLGQRRSVSSLKRDPTSPGPQQQHHQQHAGSDWSPSRELASPFTPSPTSIPHPSEPQWSRLRNVFPNGTDYLLDALYAHLVAYSYLSNLLPRGPKPSASFERRRPVRVPPTPSRLSCESRKSRDSNGVPKKAATLLGLEEPTSPQAQQNQTNQHLQQPRRLLRKKSSLMETLRSSRLPPPSQPSGADHTSIKDLHAGLARCIGRLVATLRAGPDGGDDALLFLLDDDGDEAANGPDAGGHVGGIDPLLVRTLCEIVSCCEEGSLP